MSISLVRTFGLVFILGTAACLVGCASQGSASSGGAATTTDAAALIRLDDEWSAAAGARNVAKVGSFYADTAIVFPPNEPAVTGRAAATQVWANYLAEPSFSISWKANDAKLSHCGGMGFTSVSYRLSFKTADGATVNDTGKFLCIWEKQADGTWKAIRDMWNSDLK